MSPSRRALLTSAGQSVVAAGTVSFQSAGMAQNDPVAHVAGLAAQGHEALMRGDIARYRKHIALTSDFTLMGPFGGVPSRSGDYTEEQWAAIGRFFRSGTNSTLELIRAYRSPEMVVLAAVERSQVEVGGTPAQEWALRVTLVFRREGERWTLAHRHADPLVPGVSVAQAAALTRHHEDTGGAA